MMCIINRGICLQSLVIVNADILGLCSRSDENVNAGVFTIKQHYGGSRKEAVKSQWSHTSGPLKAQCIRYPHSAVQ